MDQNERRLYLIRALLDEKKEYRGAAIPRSIAEQKQLLRALMNVRAAGDISDDFLKVQDEYLAEAAMEKGIVHISDMEPEEPGLYIWQGDITRLAVGAIVNAANSGMTGCYYPNHNCIDNCIHTYSGIQLRSLCADIMDKQGYEEPTGSAKITPAFNLPCDHVIHTVGPIVNGPLTKQHEDDLASCYESCLRIAGENNVESIAFCCISTGVFMFPIERAAEIAVDVARQYLSQSKDDMASVSSSARSGINDGDGTSPSGRVRNIIFNVFKDTDLLIYKRLLG